MSKLIKNFLKDLIEDRPTSTYSGLFNRDGTRASAPIGTNNPDDPEETIAVPLEKAGLSPLARRMRDGNLGPQKPSSVTREKGIRNLKGKLIKVSGSKINSAIEAVISDLMEDLPVAEDTMTGSIAAIDVPIGSSNTSNLCPCGSGKPKDQCNCNKQTTPIKTAFTALAGGSQLSRLGSRLRRIVGTLGGI